MAIRQGTLSINSENIFPIIKKWLYSDQDIFLRELVSNGCDAITKLKKLALMGEYHLPGDYSPQIDVIFDAEKKTLTVKDNGLGMTAAEVEEYINQIAFSGATDFLEKYKDKANEDQIIGHFGLGFYSAFMVADEVTIDTCSWQDGAVPVHWECDGGTEFVMGDGEKSDVGTEITLYLNEECLSYSNEYRLREVLEKYCSFMPVPIFLRDENAPAADTSAEAAADSETEDAEAKSKEPEPVNDTHPLFLKQPNECSDEEYKAFYRDTFHDYKEPLFWIHLNMDYPFNLKGILYFPKLNLQFESAEGVIKLYNNQVFIADNIKEVIPEFLLLLKGVIDCPDLPLNVSRSALQNDGFVKKISDYITKKVADKLSGLCKTEKENYEKYWNDISPFVKYGCLRDTKFAERMNDYVLFEDIYGKYLTLPELLKDDEEETDTSTPETTAEEEKPPIPEPETVYYVTDLIQQGQYIRMFKDNDMNAVILTSDIDISFITQLEITFRKYAFKRIDANITEALSEELSEEETQSCLETLKQLFDDAVGDENLTVEVKKLKDRDVASMLTVPEQERRMRDMMYYYNMSGMPFDESMLPNNRTLTLNIAHPLVTYLTQHKDGAHNELICKQLYDLARIANQPLSPEEMTAFIGRTNELMLLLAQ